MRFLKQWLTGNTIPQEYLCLSLSEFKNGFDAFVLAGDKILGVKGHILLGYSPVILGVLFSGEKRPDPLVSKAGFELRYGSLRVAHLSILKIGETQLGEHQLCYFVGMRGQHSFISLFHQYVQSFLATHKSRSAGFIQLNRNEITQVQIVYAIPRKISLIALTDGGMMNMFPTDLHGSIGNDYYVSALRVGGLACTQVEQAKAVLIADVPVESSNEIYLMGKNHMREMKPRHHFPVERNQSPVYGIPIPEFACAYRELTIIDSFDQGIHRIFIYRVMSQVEVKPAAPVLAHMHRCAIQWRTRYGIKTTFQLR